MTNDFSNKIKTEKLTLPVEGMTCASCVSRVEKALSKIDGITDVTVNLASEKATFSLNKNKTQIDEIRKSVEEAGYKINLSTLETNNELNNDTESAKTS